MNTSGSLISLWRSTLTLRQKLLRTPLRALPRTLKLKVLSGVNKGSSWIVGAGVHSCWIGSYEQEKQHLIKSRVRSGMNVWDVGANVGFYTIAFSKYVGSSGKIIALEPLAENVAYLRRHIKINEIKNVFVVQSAVAAKSRLDSFSGESDRSMGKIESASTNYLVPAVTLDEIGDRFGPPQVVKIDVEGAEGLVLRGGRTILNSSQPELWIALHGADASETVRQELDALGYKVYSTSGKELSYPYETDEVIALHPDACNNLR